MMQNVKKKSGGETIVKKLVSPKRKICFFADAEDGQEIEHYGLKGASLNELQQMKLPVPEGFTITADACKHIFGEGSASSEQKKFNDRYKAAVNELERRTGKKFGGVPLDLDENLAAAGAQPRGEMRDDLPLIVSIRASTPIDIPGAARSILNVGLTESLMHKLASRGTNPRWAYESFRRLLQMFGTVVYGIEERKYRMIVKNTMLRVGVFQESLLSIADLLQIITEFKRLGTVPEDPWEQLFLALQGIYKSWFSGNAERFKLSYGVDLNTPVALVVQSMVFGNLNERCGVGFAFSRHPNTGKGEYIVEYVSCSIGSDILAGAYDVMGMTSFRESFPGQYYNLAHAIKLLERRYKDMMELEFTIENGIFYLLNCVSARRSARAAVVVAVNMVREKLLTDREAISKIDPIHMINYLKPHLSSSFQDPRDTSVTSRILTRGTASSFGVVYGKVVMSTMDALLCKERGIPSILCLPEITADEIDALEACSGVITTKGGLASHASVWLREVGKPGIIAAKELIIDPIARQLLAMDSGLRIAEGEYVTIDGTNGYVFIGETPLVQTRPDEDFFTVMAWARSFRVQNILATVENEQEAVEAIQFGADGIGICKTEPLFYGADTIDLSRFILLTKSETDRAAAMASLQELQKDDMLRVFRAIGDRDIVVRLLNVSASEALKSLKVSNAHESLISLSAKLGVPVPDILRQVDNVIEPNPALGVRGCRAALLQSQWTILQVRAITAATLFARKEGYDIRSKILLPTAFTSQEIDRLMPLVKEAIAETCAQLITVGDFQDAGTQFELGISITVPRACLIAETLTAPKDISFLTIDTDELTQLVYGIDQNKNELTMNTYEERHVIPNNPFAVLDWDGVGALLSKAIVDARKNNPKLKVNVYGVHTSESNSIRFLDRAGVDTLTVPKNEWIPVAALAAAQAAVDPMKKLAGRPFRPFENWD